MMHRLVLVLAAVAACAVAAAARPHGAPRPETLSLPLHRHHQQRHPAPRGYAAANGSIPAYGDIWPVAIYWSFVHIGTPPLAFPVAIDSGSMTLDVPLKGCKGCTTAAPNEAYDVSASSSGKQATCGGVFSCHSSTCMFGKCHFSNTYETCQPQDPTAPCTIKGPMMVDTVSFPGLAPAGNASAAPSAQVTFGAIESQTAHFEQFERIDGVMGMAGDAAYTSVFGELVKNGAVADNMWAICLRHGSSSNGSLTLGGIDQRLYTGEMQYTPDTGRGGFYQMGLQQITIGGQAISGTEQDIIIDTGTNILLLPSEAYASLRKTMEGMCSHTNLTGICNLSSGKGLFDKACFAMSDAEFAAFPLLTLNLPGVTLNMTAANYLLKGYLPGSTPSQYCLGIDETGPGGLQILGDTTLENYYTVFDRKNQRIGWAPVSTTCGSL